MRLRNVIAIATKEVRHLVRDVRSLALMFLLPTMMLFIYGYAIRLDVAHAVVGRGLVTAGHDHDHDQGHAHGARSRARSPARARRTITGTITGTRTSHDHGHAYGVTAGR